MSGCVKHLVSVLSAVDDRQLSTCVEKQSIVLLTSSSSSLSLSVHFIFTAVLVGRNMDGVHLRECGADVKQRKAPNVFKIQRTFKQISIFRCATIRLVSVSHSLERKYFVFEASQPTQ